MADEGGWQTNDQHEGVGGRQIADAEETRKNGMNHECVGRANFTRMHKNEHSKVLTRKFRLPFESTALEEAKSAAGALEHRRLSALSLRVVSGGAPDLAAAQKGQQP